MDTLTHRFLKERIAGPDQTLPVGMLALIVLLMGGLGIGGPLFPTPTASAQQVLRQLGDAARERVEQPWSLWQRGRYGEAIEGFAVLEDELDEEEVEPAAPIRLALILGQARAMLSQGESDLALERLTEAAEVFPEASAPRALAAEVAFGRGRWEEAEALANEALSLDDGDLRARWMLARLALARGQTDGITEDLTWFADQFNDREELRDDPDALLIIGQALVVYYRRAAETGPELAEGLNSVLNRLYEGAIRVDELCWQGAWLQGALFLDGHNEAAAVPELQRALSINPRAAEVLVTQGRADLEGYKLADGRNKAQAAIAINPELVSAYVLLADLQISDERYIEARDAALRALEVNPRSAAALARLAAAYRLLVEPDRALEVEAAARADNPRPAEFYAALGERLADRRKYPEAERAFLLAAEADPTRADNRIGLGMLYMQIGREAEADALFEAAFDADPFNIRADNMMKVLDHLEAYEAIETEHYRVLIHPDQDRLLGQYMAEYLESVHDELTDRFDFEPSGKTLIEILEDHQWFSGRTLALPFIPTVGACTGKVVALASPRANRRPFNWARVLKHEVVHVITLQQTEFNIPHWYTEALAVDSEGFPRPQPWNEMLLRRVPDRKLLDLETINLGFIRPSEPEERQLAYCQAQLYARYMLREFGDDALARMLEAYRLGMTTPQAVEHCFPISVEDFEAGYLEYLDEVVDTIRTRVEDEEAIPYSRLERMLAENPDDPDVNAKLAFENLARRSYREARPYADKALEAEPNHPLASYVKARLFELIGDTDSAVELLEPAVNPERPDERVIDLLAKLYIEKDRVREAEALYTLANRDDPYNSKWIAGLARVHLRLEDQTAFLKDLEKLAANDADDLDVRKALASRYLQRKDYEDARRWAESCLHIQVYDAEPHVVLADAAAALGDHATAVREYEVALQLKAPDAGAIRERLEASRAALEEGRGPAAAVDAGR